jgi:two-component system, NarL family, invasion response regulator UvrY
MTRLFLIDDHALMREGLRTLLRAQGLETVGEAGDAPSALLALRHLQVDVVLLDIGLVGRSGLDLLSSLMQRGLPMRVVLLTMSAQPRHLALGLRLGALGYVLKGSPSAVLVKAIESVHNGQRYIDPALEAVVQDIEFSSRYVDPLEALSMREREVLEMVVRGSTSTDIAEHLHLSAKTVDTYRSRVMRKLGVSSLPGLVTLAVREGLLDPEMA